MKTLKTLAAALCLASTALAAAPAHAGIVLNGFQLNGLKQNGIVLNGFQLNGLKQNGIVLNGIVLNGLMLNGVLLNGIVLNGTTATGLTATRAPYNTAKPGVIVAITLPE